MRLLATLLYGSLSLAAVTLAVLALLGGAGAFSATALGDALDAIPAEWFLFLLAVVLFLVALLLLRAMLRKRSAAARFAQDGARGRIELSPHALEELASGVLREEVGVDHFRVRLRRAAGGITILVQTGLTLEQKVAEVGRRIQEVLAERVVERTGVKVGEVKVLVGSFRAREGPRKGGGSDADPEL
jgi:hypothetical protein